MKKSIILIIIFLIILLKYFIPPTFLNIDNLSFSEYLYNFRNWINKFGVLSPLIYIFIYIIVCIVFIPASYLTIIGGIIFGPIFGTIYSIIGASIGLAFSFYISRYLARDFVANKFSNSDIFKKIDNGIEKNGWRFLLVTRLVPIFPFNIQNYIYGLTNINFFVYFILSTIFIIPGTAMYSVFAGAIAEGTFDKSFIWYIGIASICFVFISLIPKFINKNN